jgi:uncharacterized protein (TIGR02118 family)
MACKLIFVLYRRPELSAGDFAAEWAGSRHADLVRRIPGLVRWVQNRVAEPAPPGAPDGIGELWFDSDRSLARALASPELGAAADDAELFADMERTYAVGVDELTPSG